MPIENKIYLILSYGDHFDLHVKFESRMLRFYRSLVPRMTLLIPEMDSVQQS